MAAELYRLPHNPDKTLSSERYTPLVRGRQNLILICQDKDRGNIIHGKWTKPKMAGSFRKLTP